MTVEIWNQLKVRMATQAMYNETLILLQMLR